MVCMHMANPEMVGNFDKSSGSGFNFLMEMPTDIPPMPTDSGSGGEEGDGIRAAGSGFFKACASHSECDMPSSTGNGQFCGAWGGCDGCKWCHYHLDSIDGECPAACGEPAGNAFGSGSGSGYGGGPTGPGGEEQGPPACLSTCTGFDSLPSEEPSPENMGQICQFGATLNSESACTQSCDDDTKSMLQDIGMVCMHMANPEMVGNFDKSSGSGSGNDSFNRLIENKKQAIAMQLLRKSE